MRFGLAQFNFGSKLQTRLKPFFFQPTLAACFCSDPFEGGWAFALDQPHYYSTFRKGDRMAEIDSRRCDVW